ncbi:MAG: DnaA family protein [Patiriisocius sp.]|jgi:DnaA family protein
MVRQFTLDFKLSPDAVFANYIGDAAGKIRQISTWQYLWGRKGSGRSHLLQAACQATPGSIYLSELKRLSPEVVRDLETMPLVCLDNIDSILTDPDWQQALFHLMNGVKDRGGQLLMAAELPANQQNIKLKDLRSRLNAATPVETDRLSDSQKIRVLVQRAKHWGFDLSEDVGRFILSRSPRDMIMLVDMLKRLEIETLRQQKRVTIPFVKQTFNL